MREHRHRGVVATSARRAESFRPLDGSTAVAERGKSIATEVTVWVSVWLSLGYHLLLLVLFADRVSVDLIEFWVFFFCDVFLWTLALVPLVAVCRRRLAWYDPFSLLSLVFFGMTCMFSLAYFLDPPFVRFLSSYGGDALRDVSESDFLSLTAKAELILGTFSAIMLLTNHRVLKLQPSKLSRVECKAALWTTALCLVGGAVGFLSYWRTPESFVYALTVSIGKAESLPELGTSRYLILVHVAVTGISLGLIGWLGLARASKQRGSLSNRLVLLVGGGSALVNIWNGARADVLFAFLTILIVAKHFGFKIKKATWLIIGTFAVIAIGAMTILRGNPYLADKPGDVISQVLSGEAFQAYGSWVGSHVGTLLGLDRISVWTMVLAYLGTTGTYLHGESLVAGPVNIIADWISRVTGSGQSAEYSRDMLTMASETITFWRYGGVAFGGVPPSIPGEFYMQFGVLSLLGLSFLFGLTFYWLRKKIAVTDSLIGRWSLVIITVSIIKLLSAEVSMFASVFLYYILPVILVYEIVFAVLRVNGRLKRRKI